MLVLVIGVGAMVLLDVRGIDSSGFCEERWIAVSPPSLVDQLPAVILGLVIIPFSQESGEEPTIPTTTLPTAAAAPCSWSGGLEYCRLGRALVLLDCVSGAVELPSGSNSFKIRLFSDSPPTVITVAGLVPAPLLMLSMLDPSVSTLFVPNPPPLPDPGSCSSPSSSPRQWAGVVPAGVRSTISLSSSFSFSSSWLERSLR